MARPAPLCVLALILAALAPGAAAAPPRQWATVNLCDTPANPDSMGVRGGMQGTGRTRRLYMRFRAQNIRPGDPRWQTVRGAGTSPWVFVGTARRGSRQAGWTFDFESPGAAAKFRVRGIVEFQWRAKDRRTPRRRARWVVVKRRRAVTRTGLQGVDAGDPPGTSRASCLIA